MESSNWISPLVAELWTRDVALDSGSGNLQGFHFQANTTSNFINELKFAAAKSIRSSVVILSSFNAVVAFATAAGILWEAYTLAKRRDPKWRFRSSGFGFIGPAEAFPFVLSCGIVVQGIVFAVSQAKGMEALLILGCTLTSQLMLPAIFITPFIQLVFGLELTWRALQPRPFPSRGKWNITICLVVIGLSLLVTFVTTFFVRPPSFCFASLFWFVQRYKLGCFGLLVSIVSILLIVGVVIFVKLYRNIRIDITERIAASRMVCFIAVAVISHTLVIPFFYNLSFSDPRTAGPQALELSLVASVSANLSGLLTGGLHLFLRATTITTIGPRNYIDSDSQEPKKGARPEVSSNDYSYQINQPVSPFPRIQRTNSHEALIGGEKDEEQMIETPAGSPTYVTPPNPLRLNAFQERALSPMIEEPNKPESLGKNEESEPNQVSTPTIPAPRNVVRKSSSYNMFPTITGDQQPKSPFMLPTTTYIPSSIFKNPEAGLGESLLPPPRIRGSRSFSHRRDSSLESSATVQIGLRLSNVNDMPPRVSNYVRQSNYVYELGCLKEAKLVDLKRPSPMASNVTADDEEDEIRSRLQDTEAAPAGDEAVTLAPAVYSPNKPKVKVTSPKGVGFATRSPERVRARADSRASQAEPQVKRPDWI